MLPHDRRDEHRDGHHGERAIAATPRLTRRRALGLLGTVGIGAVATACGGDDSSSAGDATGVSSREGSAATTAPRGSTSASCVLTPEVTEGPYYIDADLVRRDITEGRPGTPVELAVTVVDADTCAPVRDAAVDVWHCDAEGIYSGFEAASTGGAPPGGPGGPGGSAGGGTGAQDSTRYLRGTQITADDGVATFRTVYPGWYRGRTVHVHTKVHVDSATRHTGQLFFDDGLTDEVYAAAPYSDRGSPDTRNDDDDIYAQAGGRAAVVSVQSTGDGYRATITVGISRR
jgi:protocatechuate 3,4-dioxygenase beta subunit